MATATAPAKCILVLGPPGIGKTTVVTGVFESLRASRPHLTIRGFFTMEVREGSDRVGFEAVMLDGRHGPLASSKISNAESLSWPTVGEYKVDVQSYESLVLPELQVKEGIDLFIIDEVGKMQLRCPEFFHSVLRVLESNIPILASITKPLYARDVPAVGYFREHPGAVVLRLNAANRDKMKEKVYNQLVNIFPKT